MFSAKKSSRNVLSHFENNFVSNNVMSYQYMIEYLNAANAKSNDFFSSYKICFFLILRLRHYKQRTYYRQKETHRVRDRLVE